MPFACCAQSSRVRQKVPHIGGLAALAPLRAARAQAAGRSARQEYSIWLCIIAVNCLGPARRSRATWWLRRAVGCASRPPERQRRVRDRADCWAQKRACGLDGANSTATRDFPSARRPRSPVGECFNPDRLAKRYVTSRRTANLFSLHPCPLEKHPNGSRRPEAAFRPERARPR
jgi:hypothetical protein